MRANQALPLFLLLGSLASCSSVQRAEDLTKSPSPATTVKVRNLKPIDYNLYVLTGTHQLRLGTVPGMTTRFFVVPPHVLGEKNFLRFRLDTIGSFGHSSFGSKRQTSTEDPLLVHAGEQFSLTIP
jgi:hypothetical protein